MRQAPKSKAKCDGKRRFSQAVQRETPLVAALISPCADADTLCREVNTALIADLNKFVLTINRVSNAHIWGKNFQTKQSLVCPLICRDVCLLRRREAAPLVSKTSTRHGCKRIYFYKIFCLVIKKKKWYTDNNDNDE